ncbi:Phage minor structural protein GP20 [Caloranaerobacter azorensis DSM 13643]|uniref:Phage minor structural protein GP20 n=1 Tax=Caloranaerobacter azorensis DSM 13643 TaxID=1121264 RepID=A0A1M5TVR4_9FIRM|nr:phage scaffolding protein [Caloranaerobacter azorensis]SHH54877.1 Phage minor structural protein GP20 [Caloranaerobacter azorensis DSM 13643]
MTKEQLIEMGLTEEQAEKVLEAHKEELKGFIPKARFDEVNETKKELEQQIKERDKQLKELQDKVKGNEELERTIKELQEANKATKEQYEAKIKDMTINAAIQSKLTDAKYPELLISKFDKSKLSVAEDGTVLGIDEQLATLKERYKDLFKPDIKGKDPNNTGRSSLGDKNPWSKEHFNLTEQGKLIREDPGKAKQLIIQAGGNPTLFGL